jgi:hypothetical protein
MTDPAAAAARSAAAILAAELGPGLPAQVEAALAARGGQQRPDQYVDPVSIGILVVAIATLAWEIYRDKHKDKDKHATEPAQPSVIARQVRIALRERDVAVTPGTERITEVVATEIIRYASEED